MSTEKVTLNLDKTGKAGYQISINLVDEQGHGHGYRVMGPKYLGDSQEIRVVTLNERDASEIRQYLDHIDGGDAAAERRGFDLAVALLRDLDAVEVWRASLSPDVGYIGYGVANWSHALADFLEAHRAAPAVLRNGEQA